ncbi:hypothetical protein [Burkholderia pseudomallei]|uniref:hypothetical protein n=1 Tax=Burkholderia pseudomallei TaxID=28450 RepID=UPI001AD76FF1|nr:hypothetical protein [Burkholderia pseudomallei]MBO7788253.1 hypothetical protein [Burkholderia pseudomallei]
MPQGARVKRYNAARAFYAERLCMVLRLPNQSDEEFTKNFHAIDRERSTLIRDLGQGPNMLLWNGPIHQMPEASGYWIGEGSEINAFLIAVKAEFRMADFWEIKRAWVDPKQRGKGLFSTLISEVSKRGPLLSDREGMSDAAFAAWLKAKGFERRWFDVEHDAYVEESMIPNAERFGSFPDDARWQIVLEATR